MPLAKPPNTDLFMEQEEKTDLEAFQPSVTFDLELSSHQWSSWVVGNTISGDKQTSHWVSQQLAWANHLNLKTALFQVDVSKNELEHVQRANFVCNALYDFPRLSICLRLVMDSQVQQSTSHSSPHNKSHHSFHDIAWNRWNLYQQCCHYHPLQTVALEWTQDTFDRYQSTDWLKRWLSEPVRYIILDTRIFLCNRQGYPVLSKSFQWLLSKFFVYSISVIIRGEPHHPNGYAPYLQYIAFLYSKTPTFEDWYRFEMPYFDYLQCPLQPLADHLDSQTYEIFEQDPIKYKKYEEALVKCFQDKQRDSEWPLIVMVLGAGRGPLVRAAIQASNQVGIDIRIYAIEKNPYAAMTLKSIQKTDPSWQKVEIITQDMRQWKAPELAHVVVSELLGSFGDNELSPECLDAAQLSVMKPNAVSIPCQYTSYLCPLASPQLLQEIQALSWREGETHHQRYETPYVVCIHHGQYLSDTQPCFQFQHPNPMITSQTLKKYQQDRYCCLSFEVQGPIVVHGFAGFFEAILYGDIQISTNPSTLSKGMFSWFPFYFPCYPPICCKQDGINRVTIHLWRKVSDRRIWYEWMITEPIRSKLYNAHGHCDAM
eukprot:jgi/Galph1/3156/GphlegSOOS_G1807.1